MLTLIMKYALFAIYELADIKPYKQLVLICSMRTLDNIFGVC